MPQVIGLDVGARSIKAALFERGFRGLEFRGMRRVEFDPADPEGLAVAMQRLASGIEGLGSASIAARVPGDRLLLRFVDLPLTDGRKLEQVIPFELEQLVPCELEEIVLDHAVVRKTDGGSRVFIAAARRGELKTLLDGLTAKGLDPRYLGPGAAALATLATAVPELAKGRVALVDAGFARTDVCLLDEGRLAYARTVSGGWADFADAYVASGGSATELAELEIGSVAGPRGLASNKAAEFVAREVARTLCAAEIEARVQADRIVLFGGMASTRGFRELLQRTADLPVEPLNLSENDWSRGLLGGAEALESGAAVALAFRAVSDLPGPMVNFRRDEFVFRRDGRELSGVVARFVGWATILFVFAALHYAVKERLLASEKAGLEAQIAAEVSAAFPDAPKDRLRTPETALSIMRGKMDESRERLTLLGGGGSTALEVLRLVSAAVPEGLNLDVKEFSFADGKVKIVCVVDNYDAGDKLTEAIRRDTSLENVTSRDSGSEAGGRRKLTIAFDLKPGEGGG